MIWPLTLGAAAAVATLLGGALALRLGERIHLILGLSAGIVLGVALFDILPEAIETGRALYVPRTLLVALAGGFALYMLLNRLLPAEGGRARGHLGAASLTVHSFLDGLGIGLAFQVSAAVGTIVAVAVLAHDLSDGANTVSLTLMLNGASDRRVARRWLVADAIAPVLGVAASRFVQLPPAALAPLLAAFSGAFLYIGAVELLPNSYRRHPRLWTSAATIAGLAFMYGVAYFSA